jgi:GNAT superfamily N-acetyltransferase
MIEPLPITVREARPDEHVRLGHLVAEAYRSAGVEENDAYLETIRNVAARAASCTILAAEVAGRLVGCVTYVPGPDSPYAESEAEDEAGFRMLGVAAEATGRGVGRALVSACVGLARSAGRRRIVLLTLPGMVAARHIYSAMGFVRSPARDWSPEPGIDLLGYELEL